MPYCFLQHSTSKLPSYEEVDVAESLRKQCHDLQGEKQALENEVASLKNGPCKDPSHAYDTEVSFRMIQECIDVRTGPAVREPNF